MSYAKERDDLRDTLEVQYLGSKAYSNKEKEKDVLQKLVAFRLIESDDARISKKALKALNGGEDMPFMRKDYRAEKVKSNSSLSGYITTEFLPDNIFFGTIQKQSVKIRNRGYWGERRELQYRGDIIVPEAEHDFTLSSEEEYCGAIGALKGLESLMRKVTGKLVVAKQLVDCIKSGQTKICKIMIENGYAFAVRCLGYVVVTSVGRDKVKVRIYLDTEQMLKYRLVIKESQNRIADVIKQSLPSSMNVEFVRLEYIDKAVERQKEIASKEKPLNYDKFCDIENETLELDGEPIIEK